MVPPNQAEMMVEALQKKGLAVSVLFSLTASSTASGGRKPSNETLDAELYFYAALLLKKGLRF